MFNVFQYIDPVLVAEEGFTARVARKASVRPSEASAVMFDQSEGPIQGACHRMVYLRQIGTPKEAQITPEKAMQFRTGKAIEEDLSGLSQKAGILVAAGVRVAVPNMNGTLEIDAILLDPETGQGIIIDCKTVSGWGGNKKIKEGKPKITAVMQEIVYLNEFPTGTHLKNAILEAYNTRKQFEDRQNELTELLRSEVSDKQKNEWSKEFKSNLNKLRWNRVHVDWSNFEAMSDGPVAGMLIYISRDSDTRRQFDIGIATDPLDGYHYPVIDGIEARLFTVESIYERYNLLQAYYQRAFDEGVRLLELQGVQMPPDDAPYSDIARYWDLLGAEMQNLPISFLPPAEYEWKYSPAKIEDLFAKGLLPKTVYDGWKMVASGRNRKPRPVPTVGAWQCNYCDYRARCIALQDPAYANMAQELMTLSDDEAA